MTACDDFMKALDLNGEYGLTMPTEATPEARRLACRSGYYDRGGTEVLISVRRGYAPSIHQNIYDQRYYSGPTLNYVNMFPWADGKDFDENFNWSNPSKQPFFDADGTPLRDPRLYETVAVPGDKYFNGTPPPIYTNHPNYRNDGTGFLMMKFILTDKGVRDNRPVQWPYLRLPEVLLSYAEALNEVNNGPTATAYSCINQVRARVGLSAIPTSGMDKKKFLTAILKERALEFGFEEVRWFDMVRRGMAEDFKKTLYGLVTTGNDANNPTAFTFKEVFKLPTTRYWSSNWDTKWYLQPIPQNEINKAYGMTQNTRLVNTHNLKYMKMKKYILTVLFGGALMTVSAQDMNEDHSALPADSIHLGYQIMLPKAVSPYSVIGLGADVFLKSPEIDVSKALYGHIAGLNVYQGTGSSATNVSSLSIHGHNPLVLVERIPAKHRRHHGSRNRIVRSAERRSGLCALRCTWSQRRNSYNNQTGFGRETDRRSKLPVRNQHTVPLARVRRFTHLCHGHEYRLAFGRTE